MIKVLFICHGNICRSTMAEYIFAKIINEKRIADQFEIDSAATSREEIGNPIYPPAKRKLDSEGISIYPHVSRQITKADLDHYDYIILMDENNSRNIKRMFGDYASEKVKMILDYTDNPRDIADPWYTGNFDITYDQLVEGCKAFLNFVMNK